MLTLHPKAAENTGIFWFQESATNWRTLVAAGSNTDCNGRFRAQRGHANGYAAGLGVGNVDIHNAMANSLKRFSRVYDGRERMRAYGGFECGNLVNIMPFKWQIRRWGKRV